MIPYQLQSIVEFLRNVSIEASNPINGEMRVASLKDEENIRNLLLEESVFRECVKKPPPRSCGDILVKMNDIWQPVNIKTTKGTVDNATSKTGIVFAFTNLSLEEIPSQMNDIKMWNLVKKNKQHVEGKDYWYLTFDKNDMSQVRAYGLRQIRYWKSNPSNDLQINWKKQWEDKSKTPSFEESYLLVESKWQEICDKKLDGYHQEFLKQSLKKNLTLLNEILEEVTQ